MTARAVVGLALLLVIGSAHADFAGEVIGVLDGDTVDVLVDRKPVRVRLENIDAPEKRQAFGTVAKQTLAAAVFRRRVVVKEAGVDFHGRTVGTIMLDGRNINAMMVEEGAAWVYRQYLHDRALLGVEAAARSAHRGLWADPRPVPPWEWRRENRDR